MAMNFQPSRWIGTRTERMVSMKSSAPAKKCRRQCSDSPPRLKGVRDCSAGRFPTRNLNLAARQAGLEAAEPVGQADADGVRSEEYTSELQSLMRISYAVFCLKYKNYIQYYNIISFS